jgi:hypothetical protein
VAGGTPAQDSVPCPSDEQSAIDYAVARGAIVVAAGGNSGLSGSPVEDPGVCLGVVSVGAIDSHGVVAPFSSRHPYLTLVAPGIGIASLGRVPGAAYLGDGTSQATAITSAALALVWSKHPSLTGREIVTRVLATLKHRAPTHDPAYGYGSLAVRPAVLAAVPAQRRPTRCMTRWRRSGPRARTGSGSEQPARTAAGRDDQCAAGKVPSRCRAGHLQRAGVGRNGGGPGRHRCSRRARRDGLGVASSIAQSGPDAPAAGVADGIGLG